MKQAFTNTKVQENSDGSICIWFSPDGNPKVKYLAEGDGSRLEGNIKLHLLKKGLSEKDTGVCHGRVNWLFGVFYPYQPLGGGERLKKAGFCPPKHEYALLHAINSIPKIRELLK